MAERADPEKPQAPADGETSVGATTSWTPTVSICRGRMIRDAAKGSIEPTIEFSLSCLSRLDELARCVGSMRKGLAFQVGIAGCLSALRRVSRPA